MPLNLEYAKKHWTLLLGGFAGLVVLYYLLKHQGQPAAASDVSGAGTQLQALSAAADLTNAQTNAQITTAAYQAGVVDNQTRAQLVASLATTAAQLDATNKQTLAGEVVQLGAEQAAVSIQQLKSTQAVEQTAIEGQTLTSLAGTAAQEQIKLAQIKKSVAMAQISAVSSQIDQIFKRGSFDNNISAFAATAAEELGQGYSAPGLAGADAQIRTATSPAATIGAIGGAASSIFSALFG